MNERCFEDRLYDERNDAVMLAVRFAQMLGLKVGIGSDPLEMNWPVLYVTLPTGEQVSWRLPPESLVGKNWPACRDDWDKLCVQERQLRIERFLRDFAAATPNTMELKPAFAFA